MATEIQSDILSANTIKKVMPSCLIYALFQSVTFMVDAVLSGHFIGSDAVAAVAMGIPIIGIMLSFTGMILQGGYLKILTCLGRSDMEGYNRIFSIMLIFTIIVDLIFIGLCFSATDVIIDISGGTRASAQAIAYAHIYIRAACLMIIFFALGSLFQLTCASFGYQTERMIASVINVTVNIVASVIAIQLLSDEYKIAGLGIGSAIGSFAQMVAAFVMMMHRKIKVKFRLYAPNKENIVDCLDCMRRGLPSSIDNILDSASISVVNNIILAVFSNGTAVLALVSMIKTINSLVRTVGKGALYASEPLMGILYGSRDNSGICRTFKVTAKLGVIYAAILAVIIIVLHQPILNFYGVAGEEGAQLGLILVAISGIVIVFPFMFNAAYESTGHLTLALLVAVVPDSILYPIFIAVFGGTVGVTGVWLAMGYSFIPFFIVYYCVFVLINKNPAVSLEKLLVLREYEDRDVAIDISIPAESTQLSFVSETLQRFFLERGTSSRLAYISALCTEEIAADYMEHRRRSGFVNERAYMDIKAFRNPGNIEIIIRNYDKPYDPLIIDKEAIKNESFSKIGIMMVQKISSEILYSYAYHLNIVSIIIPAEEQ